MTVNNRNIKIFLIVIFLSFLVFAHPLPAQKKPRIVPVGVARVQELATQSSYSYPGTVQAWATTKLASEVEGRVKAMLFQEGDYVKKRTPLVKLRIDPLILQRRLVRAEKKMVEIRLEELLAGTRTETIEAARSAVAQSEAKVHLAENELRRIKKLFKEGVLSLDEFDKADSQAQAARAELEEKQSVLNELVAGPRAEKIKQETANLKAAEARLQMIQDDINRATIKAPFNGYIVKKETEVGQWLEKGDPAVSMIAAKPLKVEIHVPQFQFNRIQMGASARIIFEHFGPTGGEKVFKGTVVEKIRVGDPVSRTFPVRLKVSRPNSQLAPGMLVRVELKVGKRRDKTLFVPKDAIVRTPRDTSVWIVRQARDKTMKAHKVAVQTGRHEKNLIAVQFDKHKIKPGDWVVVQGNERLKPKMRVKIISRIQ